MVALLPYQEAGARFLADRPRAILADAPRVGKTPQAIAACDLVRAKHILTLAPAIARPNWLREFARFSWFGRPGRAIVKAKDAPDPYLTVCSYDNVHNPRVFAKLSAMRWDVVIADEFHLLKNLATRRAEHAYALMAPAPYVWALSGTPAPNDAGELWPALSQFGITDMTYWQFMKRYVEYWEHPTFGVRITGNRNADELRALMAPHCLRRTLAEVAPEMPAQRVSSLVVEPGPISDAYQDSEFMARAREEESRLADALDAAQGQLESLDPDEARHYRRLVGLQKVQPLAELVGTELDAGMSCVVIFGWHTDVLAALRLALDRFGARVVDGRTSPAAREDAQAAFRLGICRVLVLQIITAGTAIDLSEADDALFAEWDWTPANNQQAAMRIVSQFKRRPTRVRYAAIADSVDERVMRAQEGKQNRIAEIID
ncbi:MAG TPA: DEAD/DEAH box helicase [Solimonas sp.]|nr:DEAD/DEAH box helicase [Solimonas sp.]